MHDFILASAVRRKTAAALPGRHEFETLNGLRGLAALIVLVWHMTPLQGERFWSAYLAVDLFFLLSGVVVAHAYEARLGQGWGFGRFLEARIIRLWPLYLLGSALGAVVLIAGMILDGAPWWAFKPLAFDLLRGVVLAPRLGDVGAAFPLDPPAWSLFCEVVVNIGYGLVGYRLGNRSVLCVALLSLVVMALGASPASAADAGLNLGALVPHLWIGLARAGWGFSIGVLIYRAWRSGRLPRVAVPPMALGLFFVAVLFVLPRGGPGGGIAAVAAAGVILPMLVMVAVQVEPSGLQRRIGRLTADLSYPIYVTHAPFYMAASIVAAHTAIPSLHAYAGAMALALVIAPLADRFLDRPVRGLLTRATRQRRAG